ncbi:glycosyltransferase family 4 protein [Pseudomonas frederiksbergensis]|uniref:Glycosyltransferase family 4 protein n=1 Tax=Pseudomonas wuhanensis TaxID=2954098 RepID=A0ABY9GWK5_9PSED|nr:MULTISPECIES: glycosyltransferase family 4 protein [unclassified Pseudomonas]URM30403.1 glycosyltransferase family 4 protein [Pseudomonas frederiksbergensis]WLI14166.1 glycosyltransferase family 4 protein [Pseudomonas sp. FP603]WLI20075.1 glycosyltransferase family 4 protein [Pseudomonas sp. FP607]
MIFALLVVVFAISWGLTRFLRRYALSRSLMDIPNERSAHSVPTPRGGGVSIVVAFLFALPVLTLLELLPLPVLIALSGAGMLIAAIGFADDHGHIAARWRLLGHFIAAGWALFWLNGLAPIELLGVSLTPGWLGGVVGAIYLVWMLNLYNFMDGIDGLASAEAISVCLGMCLVYWVGGVVELVWAPLVLAGAVAGFLCWNFPPARIFMGDAGSGFLGIILGAMALQAAWSKPELIWSWLILLGVFIVDATWTLVRRLIRGDKVYQAHSSHAYQNAARRWGHKKVTISVAVINVAFLLPLSILVVHGHLNVVAGIFVAYAPLVCLAYLFKAGRS